MPLRFLFMSDYLEGMAEFEAKKAGFYEPIPRYVEEEDEEFWMQNGLQSINSTLAPIANRVDFVRLEDIPGLDYFLRDMSRKFPNLTALMITGRYPRDDGELESEEPKSFPALQKLTLTYPCVSNLFVPSLTVLRLVGATLELSWFHHLLSSSPQLRKLAVSGETHIHLDDHAPSWTTGWTLESQAPIRNVVEIDIGPFEIDEHVEQDLRGAVFLEYLLDDVDHPALEVARVKLGHNGVWDKLDTQLGGIPPSFFEALKALELNLGPTWEHSNALVVSWLKSAVSLRTFTISNTAGYTLVGAVKHGRDGMISSIIGASREFSCIGWLEFCSSYSGSS